MADFDNTDTFVLFINDNKATDKSADRTGTLNVGGVEYFMDGWLKQGKKGAFLSGKIKRKDKQQATPPAKADNFPDDEITF